MFRDAESRIEGKETPHILQSFLQDIWTSQMTGKRESLLSSPRKVTLETATTGVGSRYFRLQSHHFTAYDRDCKEHITPRAGRFLKREIMHRPHIPTTANTKAISWVEQIYIRCICRFWEGVWQYIRWVSLKNPATPRHYTETGSHHPVTLWEPRMPSDPLQLAQRDLCSEHWSQTRVYSVIFAIRLGHEECYTRQKTGIAVDTDLTPGVSQRLRHPSGDRAPQLTANKIGKSTQKRLRS